MIKLAAKTFQLHKLKVLTIHLYHIVNFFPSS